MPIRVLSASESAEFDREAIEAQHIPSRALMRVASANAATAIMQRYADRAARGVVVYTGAGNNGGDGWCVARALARAHVPVVVREIAPAATDDARAERELALPMVRQDDDERYPVIVDALLGTGAHGPPRGAIAAAVADINRRRAQGDVVVSLDVPSGLDATTGDSERAVMANLTIAFGHCKRGVLVSRACCGEIVVVDIGLASAKEGTAPILVDAAWVRASVPTIPADAHKGMRKTLTIVGGTAGMGGAAILAAHGALASGIGLVRVVTHEHNLTAVRAQLPEVLTQPFPAADLEIDEFAQHTDAMVIGPGLGRDSAAKTLIERLLRRYRGPVVLDADAITVFAGQVDALGTLLRGRPAIITPHPAECGSLIGRETHDVLAERFNVGVPLARQLHAAVLLKGTPTIIADPDGIRLVSARGTSILATGGTGDVLSGIAGTLLAQDVAPSVAAACGAWIHGRAAERIGMPGGHGRHRRRESQAMEFTRGYTVRDVVHALPQVWHERVSYPAYPILATLPSLAP